MGTGYNLKGSIERGEVNVNVNVWEGGKRKKERIKISMMRRVAHPPGKRQRTKDHAAGPMWTTQKAQATVALPPRSGVHTVRVDSPSLASNHILVNSRLAAATLCS